ncbi:MAG: hypothetical protein HQL01_11360 [Nitrospirae bacterium]|nr:hypothetical protein [Nitrospirota bacterium]
MRVWLAVLTILLLAVSTMLFYNSSANVVDYSESIFIFIGLFGIVIAGFLFAGKKINASAEKEPLASLAEGLGAKSKQGFFVTASIITGMYNDYNYYCQYVAPPKSGLVPPQFIIRLMVSTGITFCMEAAETDDSGYKTAGPPNKFSTGDEDFDNQFKLMVPEINHHALLNEEFRALIRQLFSYGAAKADSGGATPPCPELGDLSFGSKYIEATLYGAALKDITPEMVHGILDIVIKLAKHAAKLQSE